MEFSIEILDIDQGSKLEDNFVIFAWKDILWVHPEIASTISCR